MKLNLNIVFISANLIWKENLIGFSINAKISESNIGSVYDTNIPKKDNVIKKNGRISLNIPVNKFIKNTCFDLLIEINIGSKRRKGTFIDAIKGIIRAIYVGIVPIPILDANRMYIPQKKSETNKDNVIQDPINNLLFFELGRYLIIA